MTAKTRSPRDFRAWPVLVLAAPAFVAIWGGWVGLGKMTGFGMINLLPGVVDDGHWSTLNTAITLPVGVETYAAYALHVWLTGSAGPRAVKFARGSAWGALALGFLGQVAYHLMASANVVKAPTLIVVLVAGLPVAVLGMGAALAHLIRSEPEREPQSERTSPIAEPNPVLPAAEQDRPEDDSTGPVLAREEDRPAGPAEQDHEDQSSETSPEDQPAPVRRAPKTPRPRTARRTSPKVRPIESGTAARMDRLRKAYPQSVPSNGDIKKTLGITSQGTANNLRKALIAERIAKEGQA